jgi:hypothetical protein
MMADSSRTEDSYDFQLGIIATRYDDLSTQ